MSRDLFSPSAATKVYTVSEISVAIKDRLEPEFDDVWVAGEVTDFSRPASGHLYFSLKDEKAQIGAVLWRDRAARLRFALEPGQAVLVHGHIDVYVPRGQYKVVVDWVEPRGVGALQVRFEQLRKRLAEEGLFDEARKRPLPFLPLRIGLVTAPRGAAVRDFLQTVFERFPPASVVIRPARVQGAGAAEDLASAVADLNERGDVEVIVLARGGGSLEDLWAFNEEVLVRAVAASAIPTLSAVGHEIDFTLCDFAADLRAKTPTDAAVQVVPRLDELLERLDRRRRSLVAGLEGRVVDLRERLDAIRNHWVLRRPEDRLEVHARTLDARFDRLASLVAARLASARALAADFGRRLEASRPEARLARDRARFEALGARFEAAVRAVLERARNRYALALDRLDSRSPVAILRRGYSLTRRAGEPGFLTTAEGLSPGDLLETAFHAGRALSRVERAEPAPPLVAPPVPPSP